MAKLTCEQLHLDCELVLAVRGKEYCRAFWSRQGFDECATYEEACMYCAGSVAELYKCAAVGPIIERAQFLRDRTLDKQT